MSSAERLARHLRGDRRGSDGGKACWYVNRRQMQRGGGENIYREGEGVARGEHLGWTDVDRRRSKRWAPVDRTGPGVGSLPLCSKEYMSGCGFH